MKTSWYLRSEEGFRLSCFILLLHAPPLAGAYLAGNVGAVRFLIASAAATMSCMVVLYSVPTLVLLYMARTVRMQQQRYQDYLNRHDTHFTLDEESQFNDIVARFDNAPS